MISVMQIVQTDESAAKKEFTAGQKLQTELLVSSLSQALESSFLEVVI